MTAETLGQACSVKTNKMFMFSSCNNRENLSIHASFITVGLILTKLG